MTHALVIDDDSNNLDVLAELLSQANMSYTTVQDATRISEMLDELQQVDVVFLDLEMPKIDGYQVLDFLKHKVGLAVPIVACTVHLSEINTARDQGFDSFLGKPLKPTRFFGQLERILNNEQVWEAR